MVFSATAAAQWIGIGGDAYSENVQSPFVGDIATTRLYSEALSRDEVVLAYQQIKKRSIIGSIDDGFDVGWVLNNFGDNYNTYNHSG